MGQFTGLYTQSVDCGKKMSYFQIQRGITGSSQSWMCANKPKMKFTVKTQCPCTTFQEAMHSSCYDEVQECSAGGKTYFTAILKFTHRGTMGRDWDIQPHILGPSNKYAIAGCNRTRGHNICWNKKHPFTYQMREDPKTWLDNN